MASCTVAASYHLRMLSNTIQRLLTMSTPCAVSSHSLERCLGVELQNSRIVDPLSIITAVAEQAIQSIITLPKLCVDFQNAPTEIVELSFDLQLLKGLLACVQSLSPPEISNVDQERGITILTYNERLVLRIGCHTGYSIITSIAVQYAKMSNASCGFITVPRPRLPFR